LINREVKEKKVVQRRKEEEDGVVNEFSLFDFLASLHLNVFASWRDLL
jgi:hypothetical protein